MCEDDLNIDYPITSGMSYELELRVIQDILSKYGIPVDTEQNAQSVEEKFSDAERKRIDSINRNIQ